MNAENLKSKFFFMLVVVLVLVMILSVISLSTQSPEISTRILNIAEIIITDFSAWQGDIDFTIMKQQAGATYGRCCVGAPLQGGYKDPRWDTNLANMDLVDMPGIPYAVYYPPNSVTEATQFWLTILGDEAYQHPLVIDVELDGGEDTFRVTNRLWNTVIEWERLTGIKPWIYSGDWWWSQWIEPGRDWNSIVGGYIIADYYSTLERQELYSSEGFIYTKVEEPSALYIANEITGPLIPDDWDPGMVYLWQFSSKCSGPLFGAESTYIDCNRLWNGISLNDLLSMWGYEQIIPTPTVALTPTPTFTETITPSSTYTPTPKPTEEMLPSVTVQPVSIEVYYLPYIQVEP